MLSKKLPKPPRTQNRQRGSVGNVQEIAIASDQDVAATFDGRGEDPRIVGIADRCGAGLLWRGDYILTSEQIENVLRRPRGQLETLGKHVMELIENHVAGYQLVLGEYGRTWRWTSASTVDVHEQVTHQSCPTVKAFQQRSSGTSLVEASPLM